MNHFTQINKHPESIQIFHGKEDSQIPLKGLNWTPIHSRAPNNQTNLSQVLITKDAELYTKATPKDWTPLEFVAEINLKTSIQWGLKHTGYVSAKSRASLLQYAAEHGYEGLAQILINAGPKLETKSRQMWTPLQCACERGHEGIMRILLLAGANVEASHSGANMRPIHLASAEGQAATIKVLLGSGAQIKAQDVVGLSPLCWASQEGHEIAVRVLLDAGADVSARAFEGRKALSLASQQSSEGIMQLLLDNMPR